VWEKKTARRDTSRQLRSPMRKIGFNISEFSDTPEGFIVSDFDDLVQRDVIAVKRRVDHFLRGRCFAQRRRRIRQILNDESVFQGPATDVDQVLVVSQNNHLSQHRQLA